MQNVSWVQECGRKWRDRAPHQTKEKRDLHMKAQPCPTRAQLTDRNVSAKLNAEAYALPIDVEVKEVGYDCDALVV